MQYYGYIYLITNNINNRRYVGQHKYAGYPNKDPNYHGGGHLLKKAYNKYGRENFSEEILCWVRDKEQANKFEKELTLKYKADIDHGGYVLKIGDDKEVELSKELLEYYKSEKFRDKMSKAMQGNKNGSGVVFTQERRDKISRTMTGNQNGKGLKGHKRSEKEKKNLSERMKKLIAEGKFDNFKYSQRGKNIGTRWYNNGERNIRARECPEGYNWGLLGENHEAF